MEFDIPLLQTWYNYSDIFDAWTYFMESADTMKNSPTFLHDLVDITRQALQVYGDINYNLLIPFFQAKDLESFKYVLNSIRDIVITENQF